MYIIDGKAGKKYVVTDIKLDEKVKRRLQMLGMTYGTTIEMLNKKNSGCVIFKLRGTRFAIGKKIAQGIEIGGELND